MAIGRFGIPLCARAGTTWNDSDLEHAANLARCSDIETMQMEIAERETSLKTTVELRSSILGIRCSRVLTRRSVALSRMLHVHAEATQENRQQSKRGKA